MDALRLGQELHLKDYINVAKRRKGVILLFFISTVVVVTVGSFVMPPVYEATATLFIDVESPDVLTASGMVSLESQNYYSYKEYYQSQKEIVTSRGIARKVFEEFDLGNTREYKRAKDPIEKFLETVKVEPVRDTRLLKLNVYNKSAKLAAGIANRMAEIYVRRNLYYISREEITNLLKNEYLKLETKLSEYSKIYKHKHPKMIRLKQEMEEMADRIAGVKKEVFNYDISGKEFKEADLYVLEGLKANNVSIEDPAEIPRIPHHPKKLLNFLLALIVGAFGGIGLAFFFEYLDDTVKDIDDLEALSEWPFLGNIPVIDNKGEPGELDKDLLVHKDPKNPVSEAYRAIRTSVFFSSTEEHPLHVMAVSSPGPQEGKTITLCNLGIAIAQGGKRVLLVDADMRKPRLHEVFGRENEKGLSDFLSAQAEFADVIRETDISGLSIITGGPYPPNPSELLSSQKIKELIKSAKGKFDYVMFDTPPAAVVTDAIVLSKAIDGLIMVIESGKTSKRVLPRVFRILTNSRVKVAGIAMNRISAASKDYYYYHSYYYGKTRDK